MSGIEFDHDEFGDDKMAKRICLLNSLVERVRDYADKELRQTVAWRGGMSANLFVMSYYKPRCDEFKQKCMQDSSKRINRYKVIALTQEAILQHQPLIYVDPQYANEHYNHLLNVQLALEYGFHILTKMNEQYVPLNRFSHGYGKFDQESFNEAVRGSLVATQHLWREHLIFLAAEHQGDFPVIPIAHFWYALDQWGLTHSEARRALQ